MKDKDIPIKCEMKIIDSLKDQGFDNDDLIYLIDTLEVAKREISLIDRYSDNIKKLHLERLNKLTSAIEQCLPAIEKINLPENPSEYEKTLIDRWRKEGYSEREIAVFLRDFS